jgi:hemolysin activation/secretion protein
MSFAPGARGARARPTIHAALVLGLSSSAPWAVAQNAAVPQPLVELQRQQERERALREQQAPSVDARLPRPVAIETLRLPLDESPCLRIDRVSLSGERAEDFQWALDAIAGPQGDDAPIGRCLGTEGVNLVLARAQQAVIARGYVTTRVLAGSQDLTQGELTLTLIPGRIAAIRFEGEGEVEPTSLRAAIGARPGELLDLRAIEQGLENLKRVPSAEADIQIEPSKAAGARPGDSDLVVEYSQPRRLRGTPGIDDNGTDATGRYGRHRNHGHAPQFAVHA